MLGAAGGEGGKSVKCAYERCEVPVYTSVLDTDPDRDTFAIDEKGKPLLTGGHGGGGGGGTGKAVFPLLYHLFLTSWHDSPRRLGFIVRLSLVIANSLSHRLPTLGAGKLARGGECDCSCCSDF